MTPTRRTVPAGSRRAGRARVPVARRARAPAATLLGTLAGLALGLALLAKAPAIEDVSSPRATLAATSAAPPSPATVASVIAPADLARAASVDDRADPTQGRP